MLGWIALAVVVAVIVFLLVIPRGPKTTISADEMRQVTRGPRGRVKPH